MGQIWSQIEKLIFLEICDVPWRISMATSRRGTFTCTGVIIFPEALHPFLAAVDVLELGFVRGS